MPLSIVVRLCRGRYEAGGERPSDPEWPPHPARVFCALAASADTDADWSALRWLESQPSPQVWADAVDRTYAGRVRAYVVENATSPRGGNLNWPGRNNGLRTRSFTTPVTESFAVVWPQADPPPEILTRIRSLVRNVPYVGRASGAAEVTAFGDLPERSPAWMTYTPAHLGDPAASLLLRVPYRGYTTELEAAYQDGRRSWEVARSAPYAVGEAGHSGGSGEGRLTTARLGPFEGLMVWRLTRPIARVGGDQAVRLTAALRRAVMSRVSEPVPAQVSGHNADGRSHVGFVALPDVGHEHADGHILGLALALPRELAAADLAQLVRAVVLDPLTEVQVFRNRALSLQYGADRYSIQSARWAGGDGARTWVTVTPLMLDGHLRRGRDEASEVARSLAIAGYPREVADVEVSDAPLVKGAVWRPRRGTIPPGRPQRRLVHARVTFADPVRGPVIAGSMRYLGLGLFLPILPGRSAIPARPGTRQGRESAGNQGSAAAHDKRATGVMP